MKYKIAVLFILLFFSLLIAGIFFRSMSQTGLLMSVNGWVKDLETGNPIPGITIDLFKFTENESSVFISKGTSDINGFYKIKYLEAGLYYFFIETSDRGIVYIGFISFGGSEEDYYKLEIKSGENKNLNIFIGEDPSPDVKREESLDGKTIDFIMILKKEEPLEVTAQSSKNKNFLKAQQTEEQVYKKLRISNSLDIKEVEADVKFERDESGQYYYDFNIRVQLFFMNGTCVLGDCTGTFDGKIRIHKFDWYKKRTNDEQAKNGLPPLSDDTIRCLYDCVKTHEWTHWRLAPGVLKKHWDELLKKLISAPPAKCQADCDKFSYNYINQTLNSFKIGMRTETERPAKEAGEECRKQCK
jgi:hypothetical protein